MNRKKIPHRSEPFFAKGTGGRVSFRLALLCAFCAILLAGCFAPLTLEEVQPQILEHTSTAMAPFAPPPLPEVTATPGKEATSMPPGIPERRLLILEWPRRLRVGDSALLRLSLEMDEQGTLTPTAVIEGESIELTPLEIPNLYETHRVFAQARLDLAGMQIAPQGVQSEQLLPGMVVNFIWSVRALEVGDYRGTAWLHLIFVPREGGDESRLALSAQSIEIRCVNLLGLGGRSARILGGVGSLVGSFIGLDNLVSWGIKAVQRRRVLRRR